MLKSTFSCASNVFFKEKYESIIVQVSVGGGGLKELMLGNTSHFESVQLIRL